MNIGDLVYYKPYGLNKKIMKVGVILSINKINKYSDILGDYYIVIWENGKIMKNFADSIILIKKS